MKNKYEHINQLAVKAKTDNSVMEELYNHILGQFKAYYATNFINNDIKYVYYKDELLQELYIYLDKAVKKYDITKGDFASYMINYFQTLVGAYLLKFKTGVSKFHYKNLETKIISRDGIDIQENDISFYEGVADDYFGTKDNKEDMMFKANLILNSAKLTQKEIYVYKKYNIDEYTTFDEIAILLYNNKLSKIILTRERIRQIYNDAQKKINLFLSKM